MAKVGNSNPDSATDPNFSETNDNGYSDSNNLYEKYEQTIVSATDVQTPPSKLITSQSPNTTQTCVLQQTTAIYHRNGHSRNPSSINGITIAQVMQPPLNKPDTIDSLLKLIRFRSNYGDCDDNAKNRPLCGIRERRLISK